MAITPTRKRNPSANVEMAVSRIEVKPSENGGFSVECSKQPKNRDDDGLSYQPPKTYTFESFDSMVDYLKSEFGSDADDEYED